MSDRKLGLLSGTSYAVGSIIGSGILFLPSLTYKLSGSDVFLSWALATLLCIPLLMMFYDLSKVMKTNDGVKGFIELGLGEKVGACFPALLLSTVSIGMPSSALIVGKFVQDYFATAGLEYPIALYLLSFGIITNLIGKSFGEKIQIFVSIGFFIVGAGLFILTTPAATSGYHKLMPQFNWIGTFSGITMAFWAFAGFENLTFITQDFKNPKRDFLLSMIIALVVCGTLYLGITANYAAIIPYESIQTVMGIFQLSQKVEPKAVSGFVIVALAFFALKTNFNSWVRGLSIMIKVSAAKSHLPSSLQDGNRSLYLLALLFLGSLSISYFSRDFLETGLVIVSSNFVVIYVLCIFSFLRVSKSTTKKVVALGTLSVLLFSLATSKEKLLYPMMIMAISYLFIHSKNFKLKTALSSLVFLSISQSSWSAVKELNVALILRYNDKFNATTLFLDKGLELAKRDFEKSGQFKVKFTRYPHNEKLATVIEATQKALDDGHQVIIGGENSDEAMAIGETVKDKNIVVITPTSTNPKVTAVRPYVFRTCVSDDKVADKLANFVFSNEKPRSIGILHNVSYPYSDYLSKRFSNKFHELIENSSTNQSQRAKVVEKKIIRNQMDYSQEIKAFKEQGISHLVLLSFQSDLLRFHSQAVQAGLNPIYIGSDGWGLNESIQKQIIHNTKEGSKFIGLRNVYWNETSSTKANKVFKASYKSQYKMPANAWAAIAYDTVTVLFRSFSSISGEIDGEKIRNSLRAFDGKGLLTTEKFTFDENNSPTQDVMIYRIDKKGIGFYGTI